MKRIHYSGGSLLTGDHVADAVLEYAEQLATQHTSASVTVPVLLPGGSIGQARLLLGPASQLYTVPEESSALDSDWDRAAELQAVDGVRTRMRDAHRGGVAKPLEQLVEVIDPA